MSADQAERWALRLFFALANAGTKLPEGSVNAGMAGLANTLQGLLVQGLAALQGLKYTDVGPLLDEMMHCVKFRPPGGNADGSLDQQLFPGESSQIEEVATRLKLRWELLELHLGFSLAAGFPNSESPGSAENPAA